ncbi:unnamed protein product, partial [Fusarium langsethiae]
GTRIARQHYAVHIGFPGKLQPEMIATFKEISKLWHQFLETAGEGKGKKAPKRKQGSQSQKTNNMQQQQQQQQEEEQQQHQQFTNSPAQMTISSSKKRRKKTTQEQEEALAQKKKISEKKKKKLEDEMAEGLRRLLGPKATWRSDKQGESMRSIMALKADQTAINILPTGAGKSILFMLPAVMQDTGTSIV